MLSFNVTHLDIARSRGFPHVLLPTASSGRHLVDIPLAADPTQVRAVGQNDVVGRQCRR